MGTLAPKIGDWHVEGSGLLVVASVVFICSESNVVQASLEFTTRSEDDLELLVFQQL